MPRAGAKVSTVTEFPNAHVTEFPRPACSSCLLDRSSFLWGEAEDGPELTGEHGGADAAEVLADGDHARAASEPDGPRPVAGCSVLIGGLVFDLHHDALTGGAATRRTALGPTVDPGPSHSAGTDGEAVVASRCRTRPLGGGHDVTRPLAPGRFVGR